MFHVDSGGDLLDIARGLRGGVTAVQKFGRNDALSSGSYAPVVTGGVINWLQTATTVRVKAGGNGNDTVAGTRARKVRVYGLNELWALADEEIELAGASASAVTSTTFIRVFRMVVTEVGTYGSTNEAAIVIENGAGGTDLINIAATESQSQFCAYTVPANSSAYIRRAHANISSSKAADLRLVIRTNTADPTTAPFGPVRVIALRDAIQGHIEVAYEVMQALPERTDFWIEGDGSAAGVECAAEIDFFLVNGN